MDASDTVTTAIFSAFLKCPRKACFLSLGERPPGTYFSDIEAGITSMYKSRAWRMLHDRGELTELATFGQLADSGTAAQWFDCETAVCNIVSLRRTYADTRARKPAACSLTAPVLFSPWEKPEPSDSLLVCFGSLSLSQATGTHAESGTLIYGDCLRRKTIRTSDYASRLDRIIRDIGSVLPSGGEPPLVLNAHCAACDFWSKCRGVAVERDDLSLLSGMTPKDRIKALAKGVLTISQLSYGYRQRRRRRTKPDAERAARTLDAAHPRPPARHDNKLKALAIKNDRIYVIGAPSLKLEGAPIFADVEGMPDRDFYYLIVSGN